MNTPLTDTQGRAPLKTLSVNVSADIINDARQCNVNQCMVADAIKDKYPEVTHVFVDTTSIRFTRDGVRYWFRPTAKVRTYIRKFDAGEVVEPFDFRAPRQRITSGGQGAFSANHPQGDNRTNPNKQYNPAEKRRKYAQRTRVNGVCRLVPLVKAKSTELE